ncbi:MAG TPA: asparagine synthase (glutamine-hydrolyzing) [Gemmatimonadaceae bacterium]|nr:asparagine synthase (glutamine-hydrolyzing) [Gemmatimonadaceae bacterium]
MCGICGAISREDFTPIVERMNAALIHRGPDDDGFAQLAGIHGVRHGVFGSRRLAILDLSLCGHQPMWSEDGRFCLAFNGEIYNFREIRTELEKLGAHFQSSGDTNVVLEGWRHWGSGILPRLRGMFAFALWDRDEERCYLARDTFGIKPLYFHESGGTILFASEIRALLASGRIERTIDERAMHSYLATGSVAEPDTIIESISAVPAGTYITIDCRRNGNVVTGTERFADPLPLPIARSDEIEGALDLRQTLRDSVSHHLISDVPVALFLSGGLDSSSIVAVASEVSESQLDTFTITFGEREFSEAEPALAVAKKFGTRHHEIPLSGHDLLAALPEAFAAMDQPSLDGLNTYAVSRAIRQNGIKVALSGLGGDELFAGYPSFRRAASARKLWPLRAPLHALFKKARGVSADPRLDRLNMLFESDSAALGAYRASRVLFDEGQVKALTSRRPGERRARIESREESVLSILQEVSLLEVTGYMRNTLLRDSDVFSMANSLELRVPFVDREVARAAMQIPDSRKLRRGISKPVIVETMRDILPPSLLGRRKQGFTLPFERWMRKELFDEIDSVMRSRRIETVGLVPRSSIQVWDDFLNTKRGMTWSRPWALYTLKRWADQNDVATRDHSIARDPSPPLVAAR